jgi:hypothetical protein
VAEYDEDDALDFFSGYFVKPGAKPLLCKETEDSEEIEVVENFVDVVRDEGGVGTNDEKLTDILGDCP